MRPISWPVCLGWLVLAGGLYYVVILLLYYRAQLRRLWRKKPSVLASPSTAFRNPEGENAKQGVTSIEESGADEMDVSAVLLGCAEEINALCAQLRIEKADAPVWTNAIRRVLRKYPQLKGTPYEQTIATLIASETAKNPSMVTAEQEQIEWWG